MRREKGNWVNSLSFDSAYQLEKVLVLFILSLNVNYYLLRTYQNEENSLELTLTYQNISQCALFFFAVEKRNDEKSMGKLNDHD